MSLSRSLVLARVSFASCHARQFAVFAVFHILHSLFASHFLSAMELAGVTTRQTNNSLSASVFEPSTSGPTPPSSSPAVSTGANAMSSLSVSTPIDPTFVAAVANAVRVALAAENGLPSPTSSLQASQSLPVASLPVSANVPSTFGGVPTSTGLDHRASSFLAFGNPGIYSSASMVPVPSQGRPAFSVPYFVSTFATPRSAIPTPAIAMSTLPSLPTCPVVSTPGVLPSFQQEFVLPPGFPPVPAKLVSQIIAGKYVDLDDLLPANLSEAEKEPESHAYFDGHLVVTPAAKKSRRKVEDIIAWSETFTIYCLILTSYFPHRWKDLTTYKLLILRTHRHFSGRAWRSYDIAFRQHAAASKLVDWSSMNSELFNFHTAGASVRPGCGGSASDSLEASGTPASQVICRSWNRGRCSSQYSHCRFAHRCSICAGSHRFVECSLRTESSSSKDRRRKSQSPPATSSSSSKASRRER